MNVVLDTNILLTPNQHGVDIFSEIDRIIFERYELVTLSGVVSELEKLVGPTKDGISAKIGLQLIDAKKVRIIPSDGDVDQALVDFCKKEKCIVATNDKHLRARIRKTGSKCIFLRGKNRLDTD